MKNRLALILGTGLLGTGLLISTASLGQAAPGQWQRYGNPDYASRSYDPLRSIVNQTQNDLRYASDLERQKGDPHDRYADAQGHLSSFDRKLTQGRFDNGELKRSIDKIRTILNKNVLQAISRDALIRDLEQLQRVRYDRY